MKTFKEMRNSLSLEEARIPMYKPTKFEGKKFDEVLDTYILSDDELADEFANPKNKNMKIIDLLKKHSKRLNVKFV